MKALNISFIDKETYKKLEKNPATVHSIFNTTMNVTVDGTLITVSSKASKQKHIIKLTKIIDFTSLPLSIGEKLTLKDQFIGGKHVVFNINEKSIQYIPPHKEVYRLEHAHFTVLDDLKNWMSNQEKIHLDQYDKENKILRYQFEKIDTFLKKEDLYSAKQLIGLGLGLTPIGDDILFGYLLAKQSIGEQPFDKYAFLSYASTQTNMISYQFLKDMINRHYSVYYQTLLEDFFTKKSIKKANELINFGETSGLAILTGFIYGLQKRSV